MNKYLLALLLLNACGRQVPTSSTTDVTPSLQSDRVTFSNDGAPTITPVDPNDLTDQQWPENNRTWTGFNGQR